MKIDTLTIVGVGLIGGSIGLAAKARKLAARVIGVGRNPASLDVARAVGAIDEGMLDINAALKRSQVAVFCTPVDRIIDQVLSAGQSCAAGTLLTDAGSTKGQIVTGIEGRLPSGIDFVGSHPLAGSEKRGPEHADAKLFQNRWTVVTQTPQTNVDALERAKSFWQGLGAKVRVMTPEEHDRVLAWTSHLPHLVAAALAGTLPAETKDLVATGFRDTTRIAAGDPALWTAIFAQNHAAVLAALAPLTNHLNEFRRSLEARDWAAVDQLLTHAKKVRDALGN